MQYIRVTKGLVDKGTLIPLNNLNGLDLDFNTDYYLKKMTEK